MVMCYINIYSLIYIEFICNFQSFHNLFFKYKYINNINNYNLKGNFIAIKFHFEFNFSYLNSLFL